VLVKHLPSETEEITKKVSEDCQFPGGELVSQRRPVQTGKGKVPQWGPSALQP
jgi:hypothetical protein